jgi:hypothetical protein
MGRPKNKKEREKWTIVIEPKLKKKLVGWCFKNDVKPSHWVEDQIKKTIK